MRCCIIAKVIGRARVMSDPIACWGCDTTQEWKLCTCCETCGSCWCDWNGDHSWSELKQQQLDDFANKTDLCRCGHTWAQHWQSRLDMIECQIVGCWCEDFVKAATWHIRALSAVTLGLRTLARLRCPGCAGCCWLPGSAPRGWPGAACRSHHWSARCRP
jgi:hypothetical protein